MIHMLPLPMDSRPPYLAFLLTRCDMCRGEDVVCDSVTGDKICRDCGHVLASRMINEEAEWRTFTNDDRGNGDAGARSSLRSGDDETSVFSGGSKADRDMLQRTQNRGSSQSRKDIKILEHLVYVAELSFKLGLSDVVTDKAKKIYKAAYLDGLSRLSSRDVLVASSVYYACISQRCPRSLSEVAAISSQSAKKIGKMFQVISKSACSGGNSKNGQSGDDPEGVSYADDDDDVCGLPLPTTAAAGGRESQRAVVMSRVLPEDVVSRLASLLHLPGPLICTARDVCAKVTKLQLADGVSPQAVAAAVIVLVVLGKYKDSKDEKALRSLDNICIVSFCAMSAIQRAYGLLRPHCLLILPPDFVKSIGGIQHISVDMPRLI